MITLYLPTSPHISLYLPGARACGGRRRRLLQLPCARRGRRRGRWFWRGRGRGRWFWRWRRRARPIGAARRAAGTELGLGSGLGQGLGPGASSTTGRWVPSMNDRPTESTRLSVPLPFSPFYCPFVTTPAPSTYRRRARGESPRCGFARSPAKARWARKGTLRNETQSECFRVVSK